MEDHTMAFRVSTWKTIPWPLGFLHGRPYYKTFRVFKPCFNMEYNTMTVRVSTMFLHDRPYHALLCFYMEDHIMPLSVSTVFLGECGGSVVAQW